MSSIEFAFESPWYLLLIIPSFAIILLPFLRLPKRRRQSFRKIAPVVIHLIVVTMLVLIIAGFTVVENSDQQAVILLVDLSDSTQNVQTEIAAHTLDLLDLIDENTPVGIVAFGQNQVYNVTLREDGTLEATFLDGDASNIGSALAYAAAKLGKFRRVSLRKDLHYSTSMPK